MQFSPTWSGRVALVLAALLALLIAWSVVRLVWLVVDGPRVEPAPMPPVPRAAPQAGVNGDFRWELFGSSEARRPAMVRAAPSTRLSLKLKGVVAAGEAGYAIIADSDGQDQVYRVGDELPGGARVEVIEARRVLLDHDGQTEALEMDTAIAASRGGAEHRTRGADVQPLQLAGIRGMDTGTSIPGGVASLPESVSLGRGNVQDLAGAISVLPVSGGGFRVRPGRDARLFADLGLQVNDVVTAINGQPLESEDDVQALFADIMRRGEVAITVNRQGREMTLRPDLEDILGRLE
jgi:general secretion pathway protein C